MVERRRNQVLGHLRRLLGSASDQDVTDRQLLQRFLQRSDQAAFELLVQRHARLVLSVCRGLLVDANDVDDAFQATFMVLIRKAAQVRWHDSLSGWLYQTAYRTAQKARSNAARRKTILERQATPMAPTPFSSDIDLNELRPLLHEELNRLPAKYRTALVLCFLEGKSQADAAKTLGCPASSLSYRVARGLELLRTRLSRRNIALSTAAIGTALGEQGAAATPPALVEATVQLGLRFASAQPIATPVKLLTQQVLQEMFLMKLRIFIAAALMAVAIGLGALSLLSGNKSSPLAANGAAAEQPKGVDINGDKLPPDVVARLGTLNWRHSNPITFLTYLEGDKQILTLAEDKRGSVHIWDVATGKEIHTFGANLTKTVLHPDESTGIAPRRLLLTTDRKTLYTLDDSCQVWDLNTGKEIRNFKFDPPCEFIQAALSPDGKIILLKSGDGTHSEYSTENGKRIRLIPTDAARGHEVYRFLAFVADGKSFFSFALQGKKLKQFNTATGELLSAHPELQDLWVVYAIAPDETTVAVSSKDNNITIWDLKTNKEKVRLPPCPPGVAVNYQKIGTLSFSPDSKMVAYLQNDGYLFRDTTTGKEVFHLPRGYNNVAFAADGKTIAASYGHTIIRHEIGAEKALPQPAGLIGAVNGLTLSADGKKAITTSGDGSVAVWNARTGELLTSYKEPPGYPSGLAMSIDGSIMIRRIDTKLFVWDAATGKPINEWKVDALQRLGYPHAGSTPPVLAIISPDNKTAALRTGLKTIQIYDLANGNALKAVSDNDVDEVSGVAWSGDGSTIAAACMTDTHPTAIGMSSRSLAHIRCWDVTTGKPLPMIVGTMAKPLHSDLIRLVFSSDGRMLAGCYSDGTVSVHEVISGKQRCEFTAGGKNSAITMRWLADNDRLLVVGSDPITRVFQVSTGKELGQLKGHDAAIVSLAVALDGKTVATGSTDTTALVYDASVLPALPKPTRTALTPDRFAALWNELADEDADKAFQVEKTLVDSKNAVEFLREKLKPAAVDIKLIGKLVADLDSNSFKVRDNANKELVQLGDLAADELAKALKGKLGLEAQKNIEQILAQLNSDQLPAPPRLQTFRAIEVLERLGTPEARQLLQELAKGAPGAMVTKMAQSSLGRLAKNNP